MALTDNDIVNYLRRSQQYASDRAELIVDAIEEGRDIPYDVAQECVNILYLNYGINHAKPGLSDFELEKLIEYANAYYGLNDIAAVVADPYETSIKLLGSDTPAAITDEEVLEIVEDVVAKIDLADRLIDDTAAYNNQTYSSSHIETLLALKANVEDLPESEFTQEYKDDVEANTIFRENFTHQDISHLIPKTQKGAKNGVAPLNSNTKINIEYIPDEIKNRENLIDGWNANTNEPEIPPASPDNEGGWYLVTTAGNTTIDGQTNWEVGDHLISNGSKWVKYRATDKVSGVRGNANVEYDEGLVTIDPDDLDDSATNNKFVSPGQKSAIQNLPADTNQELQDLNNLFEPNFKVVADISERDAIPTDERAFGMWANVYNTLTTYELREIEDSDVSNNNNWFELPIPSNIGLEDVRSQNNAIDGPIKYNFNTDSVTLLEVPGKYKLTYNPFNNNLTFFSYNSLSGNYVNHLNFQLNDKSIAYNNGQRVNRVKNTISLSTPNSKALLNETAIANAINNINTGGSPGGSTLDIQYNANGEFKGINAFQFIDGFFTLHIGGIDNTPGIGSGGLVISSATTKNQKAGRGAVAIGSNVHANKDYGRAYGSIGVVTLHGEEIQSVSRYGCISKLKFQTETSDNGFTECFLDQSLTKRAIIQDNTTWTFKMKFNGMRIDQQAGNERFSGEIERMVGRDTGANTIALYGDERKQTYYTPNTNWDFKVEINTTDGSIRPYVRNGSAMQCYWFIECEIQKTYLNWDAGK